MDVGDDWIAYSESIPFEPWPDGKPSWPLRLLGMTLGRAVLGLDRWKREHDRCYMPTCFRRRYRAPGAKGPHRGCPRHDR